MKAIVTAILAVASVIAHAREAKVRTISARILCLQHQQEINSVRFGPRPDALGEPQHLLIGDYSLPFSVDLEDDSLHVFSSAVNESAAPLATAKIPQSATSVTLLFVPGTGTAYRVLAIPDGESDFKADHTRFINLAPAHVRLRIADQLVDLPPGKHQTLTSLPKRDSFNMAGVAIASLVGEDWKVVSQTEWHFVAGNRLLVLVYIRPGTQRLVSLSFKDRPGSEKPIRQAGGRAGDAAN